MTWGEVHPGHSGRTARVFHRQPGMPAESYRGEIRMFTADTVPYLHEPGGNRVHSFAHWWEVELDEVG